MVIVKAGVLDRGAERNSSLFACFRACMFVLYVNFRIFGVSAIVVSAFFRGNSRTLRLFNFFDVHFSW